ncbi:piggyBac transposable element-derived protein 3-like [Macrosteles quadrilineatus]|uniref:piggyBac transposable element-derived protein 3-like n=1 Tax=Macrosteles quadrilineatus TaxID=74068 RepID=UPI0023E1A05E|nr:piggyBac transposable element-derived protein 3-like [Macrosteles quadrilineatus]
MKPIKRGYKLWCISDQKGYTLKFDVYQGKNEVIEAEYHGSGLGERVVLTLTKEISGKNRIVEFDNYFASIPLLERLRRENTLACATIRNDRAGMPQNMKSGLERGEWDHRYSATDVGVFKWQDNKSVWLVSNYHGTEQSTVTRTQNDGSKVTVACPPVVKDYNRFMGGVDLADRYRALYNVNRKSKKWWHRLFWGVLDIAFVNAYVLSCQLFDKMPVLECRRMIAKGLLAMQNPKQRKRSLELSSSSTSSSPILKRRKSTDFSVPKDVRCNNKGIHWVTFDQKRRRCEVCAKRKIQSRPYTKCSHCKVSLCVNEKKNCFAEFHEVLLE